MIAGVTRRCCVAVTSVDNTAVLTRTTSAGLSADVSFPLFIYLLYSRTQRAKKWCN